MRESLGLKMLQNLILGRQEVGRGFGRKNKKQNSPSPSSPDMSAVALAKVEGLSSEAVVQK